MLREFFQAGDSSGKVRAVEVITGIALITLIALSWPLWLNERNFPMVPLIGLPGLPHPVDIIQPLLLLLLLLLLVFTGRKIFGFVYFALFILLVLGDQNRMQPYFYMFSFMLLLRGTGKLSADNILNGWRIIIIATYFWSGVHKLNPAFIERFPQFVTGRYYPLSDLKYLSLAFPATEILIAFGLTFSKTRFPALIGAIIMHATIGVSLSPLVFGWNLIVIPWNISLIFIDLLLFCKAGFNLRELWSPARSVPKAIVILFFAFMPALNFFGLWDHYLSASFYSFKPPGVRYYINPETERSLPEPIRKYVVSTSGGTFIETAFWSLGEMNVLPYPEMRVYDRIRDYLCTFDSQNPCTVRAVLY